MQLFSKMANIGELSDIQIWLVLWFQNAYYFQVLHQLWRGQLQLLLFSLLWLPYAWEARIHFEKSNWKKITFVVVIIEGINIKTSYHKSCFVPCTFLFKKIFPIVFKYLCICFWLFVDASKNEVSWSTIYSFNRACFIPLLKILISFLNLNSSSLCI